MAAVCVYARVCCQQPGPLTAKAIQGSGACSFRPAAPQLKLPYPPPPQPLLTYHAHLALRHAVWAAEVDLKGVHTHSLTALNDLIPRIPVESQGVWRRGGRTRTGQISWGGRLANNHLAAAIRSNHQQLRSAVLSQEGRSPTQPTRLSPWQLCVYRHPLPCNTPAPAAVHRQPASCASPSRPHLLYSSMMLAIRMRSGYSSLSRFSSSSIV